MWYLTEKYLENDITTFSETVDSNKRIHYKIKIENISRNLKNYKKFKKIFLDYFSLHINKHSLTEVKVSKFCSTSFCH